MFSYGCARLLLAAAAEAEVVAKPIATHHGDPNARTAPDLRRVLLANQPGLPAFSVTLPILEAPILPWKAWAEDKSPTWWLAYSEVKHALAESFVDASLGNVLHAVAGLFALLVVYLRQKGVSFVIPPPSLLIPDATMGSLDVMPLGPVLFIQQL